jgi:hypothetical protein
MNRTIFTLPLLLVSALRAGFSADPAAPAPQESAPSSKEGVVLLQFMLYRISGDISGKTSLTDNIWEGVEVGGGPVKTIRQESAFERKITSGRFIFFTLADLNVAGVNLKADGSEWLWNGEKNPPPGGKVRSLEQPTVTAVAGQPFTIEISSAAPIEYFERRTDGLFELKRSEEQPGFSISTTAESGESNRIVLKDLKVSLRSVARRVPIEGVSLEVGPPVVETWEQKTTLAVKPGMDYGMQIASEGYGSLILRLRATAIKPGQKPGQQAAPR